MAVNEDVKRVAKAKRKMARTMLVKGKPNTDIQKAIKKKYGSGISTNGLAVIRADISADLGSNRTKKTGQKKSSQNAKHRFARTLIQQGKTTAEIREAVKKKYGSGIHNSIIAKLRGTGRKKKNQPLI